MGARRLREVSTDNQYNLIGVPGSKVVNRFLPRKGIRIKD
jgi:hypothetical protein